MDIKHTPTRCKNCKWIHEADSVKGTSYMGVELCPQHSAAPELLEALGELTDHCTYMNNMQHAGMDMLPIDWSTLCDLQNKARAAIAKATGDNQ